MDKKSIINEMIDKASKAQYYNIKFDNKFSNEQMIIFDKIIEEMNDFSKTRVSPLTIEETFVFRNVFFGDKDSKKLTNIAKQVRGLSVTSVSEILNLASVKLLYRVTVGDPEEILTKQTSKEKILSLPIKYLIPFKKLPFRAYKILGQKGIETISDLMEYKLKDIEKINHMGSGTLLSIRKFVQSVGLCFEDDQMLSENAEDEINVSLEKINELSKKIEELEYQKNLLDKQIKKVREEIIELKEKSLIQGADIDEIHTK